MYPDQSLYPLTVYLVLLKELIPLCLERIKFKPEEKGDTDWLVPIVADAEAGFGGV